MMSMRQRLPFGPEGGISVVSALFLHPRLPENFLQRLLPHTRFRLCAPMASIQGHLAHKKQRPRRTLQKDYA